MAFPIIPPGQYKAVITAPDGTSTPFAFTIPAPAVPVPVSITLTPASQSLPDNSLVGTKLCSVAVKMSDGSPFTGPLVINPTGMIGLSAGSNLALTRALASADDGAHSFAITATQNLVSAQATLALNVSAVAPPPPPPPPPSISADGTTSTAPSGATLVTAEGKWAWGPSASGRPGEALIKLNGTLTAGTGSLMEVANGGKLYVNTINYGWWVWSNGGYTQTSPPSTTPPPPPPPPTPATITAITFAPPSPTIPDNASIGTKVSQATVTMSDGSPFTGTLSLADSTGLFNITASGAIVTARAPTSADDGKHTVTATATTPAGMTMSARFSRS